MGLFGLFYGLFIGGMWAKDSIENDIYKSESKIRAAKDGNITYYDKHGKEYYRDRQVHRSVNHLMPDGTLHDVIIETKTHKIIKDFTQERINYFFIEREKIISEAKKNGDLYYIIKAPHELMTNNHVYEKVLKGYCGFFETVNDKRYYVYEQNGKYYKTYYSKSNIFQNISDENFNFIHYYTYDRKKRNEITKEEYLEIYSVLMNKFEWLPKNSVGVY